MYKAVANSSPTELSAAINDSVTTIPLLTVAASTIPDAPGLITIGTDSNAETIQYTGKSGNTLTGCTRGFGGTTARSWPVSTKVARYYTAADHNNMVDNITALAEATEEAATLTTQLQRGVNKIETDQASLLDGYVYGRTDLNLLGKDGGCESLTPFQADASVSVSTAQKRSGTSSIKVVASNSHALAYKDYNYKLDPTKCYLVGAWLYVESYTSGGFTIRLFDSGGAALRYATSPAGSGLVVGAWNFVHVKIPTSNTITSNGFRMYIGTTGESTGVIYFDEIRIYEISASEAAAIGTTLTGEAIDAAYPYVDGMQSLRGALLEHPGRNLVPPFGRWSLHANAAATSAYEMTLNATAANQASTVEITVPPSSQITVKAELSGVGRINYDSINAAGTVTYLGNLTLVGVSSKTFTTPADCVKVRITFYSTSAGAADIKEPLIILGGLSDLPPSFVPREDQRITIDETLRSLPSGVRDEVRLATQEVTRLVGSIELTGALPAVFSYSASGHKGIAIPKTNIGDYVEGTGVGIRYGGVTLRNSTEAFLSPTIGDAFYFRSSISNLYLSIPNSISGWIDSINPTPNAIKALLNGWRARNSNGTTYTGWISNLDGSEPATQSEAYVAANKAPGWVSYGTLQYQLAKPVIEPARIEGVINLHPGVNALTMQEGAVLREKANPSYYVSDGRYYINGANVSTKLSLRVDRILAVYKDGGIDVKWQLNNHTVNIPTYGNQSASITSVDRDPNADYYVTYIALDRYTYSAGINAATVSYAGNIGSAVSANTQQIARLTGRADVINRNQTEDGAHIDNLRLDLDDLRDDQLGLVLGLGALETTSANRNGYGTTAGTSTAYTLTLSPVPTLAGGLRVTAKMHVANGANPTINVNGLGAKPILKPSGVAPAAGLLKAGSVYTLVYDGSNFFLQGEGGEYGDAVAADVLSGKTIGTETGLVTGTMPNRGAGGTVTPGTSAQTKAAGYYSSPITIVGDANLVPANILTGKKIFDVPGAAKRVVEGTTYWVDTSNSSSITVTGLGFKPRKINILYFYSSFTYFSTYTDESQRYFIAAIATSTSSFLKDTGIIWSVTNDGFVMTVDFPRGIPTVPVYWTAIE